MNSILLNILLISPLQMDSKINDKVQFAQKLQSMPSPMLLQELKKEDYSKIKTICEELMVASIDEIRAGLIEYYSNSKYYKSGFDPFYFKPYVFNRLYFDIPMANLPIRGYFLQEGEEKNWKESWPWEAKDGSIVLGRVMRVQPLPHVQPKYTPVGDFDDLAKVYKKRKAK